MTDSPDDRVRLALQDIKAALEILQISVASLESQLAGPETSPIMSQFAPGSEKVMMPRVDIVGPAAVEDPNTVRGIVTIPVSAADQAVLNSWLAGNLPSEVVSRPTGSVLYSQPIQFPDGCHGQFNILLGDAGAYIDTWVELPGSLPFAYPAISLPPTPEVAPQMVFAYPDGQYIVNLA